MSILDGVSQCWWLSEKCVVNWDAWAAIGTVAAVFAAVFAPSIQRRLVRRRMNALFMAAYMHDLMDASASLKKIDELMPVGLDTDASLIFEASMREHRAAREHYYKEAFERLKGLAEREVDLSKWTSVDLHLATGVVLAIVTTKAVLTGASALPKLEGDTLEAAFKSLRGGLNAALDAHQLAMSQCMAQVGWLMANYAERSR